MPEFDAAIWARVIVPAIVAGIVFFVIFPVLMYRRIKKLRQRAPHESLEESSVARVAFTDTMQEVSTIARRSTDFARIVKSGLLLFLFGMSTFFFGVMSLFSVTSLMSGHFSLSLLLSPAVAVVCGFFARLTWHDIRAAAPSRPK